jgi:hypothetical protein
MIVRRLLRNAFAFPALSGTAAVDSHHLGGQRMLSDNYTSLVVFAAR